MIKLNIIKNRKFSIILIILLLVFFSWGFLSATYKTFPFNIVRNIYWKFATTNPPLIMDNEKISYITKFYTNKEFINYQKNILLKKFKNIKKDSNLFRKKIIDKYILPNKLVKFSKSEINEILNKKTLIHLQHHKFQNKPPKDSILLKVKYYNINHFGVLETNQNNKKLLIYHQGHGGNPYNFEYFLYLKEKFKSKGYDVLSLSMSGLGYNFLGNTNYSFPINAEKNSEVSFNYTFPDKEILNHSIYRSYYDNNYPKIKPLALMLSGNYYLIKNLENNYDEIIMMGISAGGWGTTMLAALLPKIKKAYSFHPTGTIPKILKMNKYLRRDWEPMYSKIWDEYDYWDFFFLALFDSRGFQNREDYLIYNLKQKGFVDDYNDPFVKVLKNLVDLTSIKNLNVVVNEIEDAHEIDIKFVDNYILKR